MTNPTRGESFPGETGPLEALYRPGEGPLAPGLPAAALLCHPHPGGGGTMHNKVVYRLARGLLESGVAVLRFNFRGVGLSAGQRASLDNRGDEGPDAAGARADIRAGLTALAERHPGAPLLLAGFSFGAWHGLAVAVEDARVERLIIAGFPADVYAARANPALQERLRGGGRPALFLHGEEDPYAVPESILAVAAGWTAPCQVSIVRGTDHFFEGRLPAVTDVVRRWLAEAPASRAEWV